MLIMSPNLYPEIAEKSVSIKKLSISIENESLRLVLFYSAGDQNSYCVVFENVSQLKLSDISFPFQICGFEIQDLSSRGYQKENRYFVNDYEDGKMSFYCEDYGIIGKD